MKHISILLYFSLFTFHFSLISAQSWLWGSSGVGDGFVTSVASDINGNCYLYGVLQNDTIHFGSYTLKNSLHSIDVFLLKYNRKGDLLWAKQTIDSSTGSLLAL